MDLWQDFKLKVSIIAGFLTNVFFFIILKFINKESEAQMQAWECSWNSQA
jgi:hypothetical protein